jgi:Mg-chelatase subunit ChlD
MGVDNELAIIELRCIPDNVNAIGGVLNTKKVRFDIETKSKEETMQRTPLNLVLILDRSGSMEADNKLTFAKKLLFRFLIFFTIMI